MLTLGTHRAFISPPDVTNLHPGGMGRLQSSPGFLDELEINLMVLQDGGRTAVICVSDELFVTHAEYADFCGLLGQRIPGASLIVCATHDHSATPVPHGKPTPEMQASILAARQKVREGFINSLEAALGNMCAVEVAAARIPFPDTLSGNRRAKLDNGSAISAFGAGPLIPPGHKCAGRPGPDPQEIDLLAFREPGKEHPKALLTGYSSHIHIYEIPYFNTEAAGAARNALRAAFPQTHPFYSVGFAGDVAIQKVHPCAGDDEPFRIQWEQQGLLAYGTAFAGAVARGLPALKYGITEGLAFLRHEEAGPSNLELLLVETLRIGPHAVCSLSGEMSLAWEDELREGLPCASLLSMGYNASWLGYVSPPLAFEEGSYETMRGPSDIFAYPTPTTRAKSATTTGARILGIARQQLDSLFPPPTPRPNIIPQP